MRRTQILFTASLAIVLLASQANATPLPFVDDFNDGDYSGWEVIDGNWQVVSGELRDNVSGVDSRIVAGDALWSDYTFNADMKVSSWDSVDFLFRVADISTGFDRGSYYEVSFSNGSDVSLGLIKDCPGVIGCATLVQGQFAMNLDQFYDIKITVAGSSFNLFIDDAPVLSSSDLTDISAGRIGFKVINSGSAYFDNVAVTQIPEPTTALLLATGLMGLAAQRRRTQSMQGREQARRRAFALA